MPDVNVHIDVLSAQTGVSRFLELNRLSGWTYDKSENLVPGSRELLEFSHLLIEAESESDPRLTVYGSTHDILYHASAFDRIDFTPRSPYWLTFKFRPRIFILKRT